jgi:hypothetical protein
MGPKVAEVSTGSGPYGRRDEYWHWALRSRRSVLAVGLKVAEMSTVIGS